MKKGPAAPFLLILFLFVRQVTHLAGVVLTFEQQFVIRRFQILLPLGKRET